MYSYQKMQQDYERLKEERERKREVVYSKQGFPYSLCASDMYGYVFTLHCVFAGISERQSTEGRCIEKVQGEENGNISVAEEEDQEGSAQPEPADGAVASEDPGSAEMTKEDLHTHV